MIILPDSEIRRRALELIARSPDPNATGQRLAHRVWFLTGVPTNGAGLIQALSEGPITSAQRFAVAELLERSGDSPLLNFA